MRRQSRVAITMGDPAGVGPELCFRLLGNPDVAAVCQTIVYGNHAALDRVARKLSCKPLSAGDSRFVEVTTTLSSKFKPGRVHAECGMASFQYVEAAITAAQAGDVDAVCTMPINKEAWSAAGIDYPGHTEVFAERTKSPKWCMMLTGPGITCSLATIHVGYSQVPKRLTTAGIVDVIELTAAAVKRLKRGVPHIGVCGLNPHAGENGLFGNREEERIIAPAIAIAKMRGLRVTGPLAPDTAFTRDQRLRYDAYVCMYHDQGLIPLKALAFDKGVNVTLGLPWPRTSPDHGTAFDIAWKGVAKSDSAVQAVLLAARLARRS